MTLLLAEHRGVRNAWARPDLDLEHILACADAFHERTGRWPDPTSGPIPEAAGETWAAVSHALARGTRGLPAGTSLAGLLAEHRGVRNQADLPRLSRKRTHAWAVAHHERTGAWPTRDSGPIPECPGDTWGTVDWALREGRRGLRCRLSLAQFLDECGAKRNPHDLPRLSYKKIVALADAHRERTGAWPNVNSGAVDGAPGERWDLIDNALRQRLRRLPGGSSLARLLARKRGARNPMGLPPLELGQVALWAEAHFRRTGEWPKYDSGPIPEAPWETWQSVDYALVHGRRTLPGGSSLAKLIAERRSDSPAQLPEPGAGPA
jgi:hypothetical protein